MESVQDYANSVFHEDQKIFKSDTFESDTSFVTFKVSILKFLENAEKVLILMSIMICKKI